jgi:hypothetical protein
MDDSSINNLIRLFKNRGKHKIAATLEDSHNTIFIAQCPLCGNEPQPDCVLCEGMGELAAPSVDDEEDLRVQKELKLK